MPWVAGEPQTLEERRAMLVGWEREWSAGGDVLLGIFMDGRVAGSCGLHRRIGPGGVEIGYWVHPAFTRRGLATTAARLLTVAAFLLPAIDRVEIHHDRANAASAGIPRKLGFELAGEVPAKEQGAPAEIGIDCRWRMTRGAWEST
jgi:ribosomal-protein-serine acetyltransferase